jgi:ADP-ribose pyrophosphatase
MVIPKGAKLIPEDAICVFEGEIFSVWQWQQLCFDGSYKTFEMIKRAHLAQVIPVLDNGDILLVDDRQPQRLPVLSLPGGRMDPEDANTLAATKRELLEETGYSFSNWKLVNCAGRLEKMEGYVYTYVAWEEIGQPIPQNLDEGTEQITLKPVTLTDFRSRLNSTDKYNKRLAELGTLIPEVFHVENLTDLPEQV